MRIIQRLNAPVKGKAMDELLAARRRNPGCFNEVWLCTLYGYPTLEKHAEEATLLAEEAKKLRREGIRVSMQLSNSIGHGQYSAARDCSGMVYEGSPAEKLVGPSMRFCL